MNGRRNIFTVDVQGHCVSCSCLRRLITTSWRARSRGTRRNWGQLPTVSGSGIRWAICKSAARSRQTTTPARHHSVFTGRMPFLQPNQQRQSTECTRGNQLVQDYCETVDKLTDVCVCCKGDAVIDKGRRKWPVTTRRRLFCPVRDESWSAAQHADIRRHQHNVWMCVWIWRQHSANDHPACAVLQREMSVAEGQTKDCHFPGMQRR